MTRFQSFFRGYLACAMWSSTGDDELNTPLDQTYDLEDLSFWAVERAVVDCDNFITANLDTLIAASNHFNDTYKEFMSQCGHSFWLSRNGHGAGFFDFKWGGHEDTLQESARAVGEVNLVVGDDGKLYFE